MSAPTWSDLHTADEWADVLDEVAMRMANRYGDYGTNSQLRYAAKCLRDLIEERDSLKAAGASLVKQVLSAVETGKPPQ